MHSRAQAPTGLGTTRAPCPCTSAPRRPRTTLCRDGKQEPAPPPKSPLSESVLQRLRAAEEEAAQLRAEYEAQLGQLGGAPPQQASTSIEDAVPARRVDGVAQRETLFAATKASPLTSWLSEADVNFFVGSAPPGEVGAVEQDDPEAAAVVRRRLLIGAALTAGAAAFALLPTEALRARPPKPLYFYIVPLLRVKALLADSQEIIDEADWPQLRTLLSRVKGPPNNMRENLNNIVALLPDTATQTRVQQLSFEFLEFVDQMDYNSYYDAMPGVPLTPAQSLKFVGFSSSAQKAASARLAAILAALPPGDVQTAVEASAAY